MNTLAPIDHLPIQQEQRSLTPEAVRERVNLIQRVMKSVMKEGTHYGIIPGCEKPSLWKPGSEVLLTTFRIAVSVRVEDLSTEDCFRYRVYVTGTEQLSGVTVGEGVGECSTNEEKYKWKRCYDKREFEQTPETRRKMKYVTVKGKEYENMLVRTEPADLSNTALKMAKKRAQIDFTLTATGASDIFTQDIEDLPDGMLEPLDTPEETPEQILARKLVAHKAAHDKAVEDHGESIKFIKACIASNDGAAVKTEWDAIGESDQRALWLATDKGGIFTTEERLYIKTKLPKPEPQLTDADREILQGAKQQ